MRNVVPSPSDDSSSRLASSISHSRFTIDKPMPSPAGAWPRGAVCEASVGAESPCGSTWSGCTLRCSISCASSVARFSTRSSGDAEDGLLTALEVAGLDLWGTRMVVLSACDTGLGDARNGEGVYGLRRALVLAGSESQVMSLWQVSDVATRELMIAYYQRLRAHEGRAEALRNVQLAMLRGPGNRVHPFYWASFIESGDWRRLFD